MFGALSSHQSAGNLVLTSSRCYPAENDSVAAGSAAGFAVGWMHQRGKDPGISEQRLAACRCSSSLAAVVLATVEIVGAVADAAAVAAVVETKTQCQQKLERTPRFRSPCRRRSSLAVAEAPANCWLFPSGFSSPRWGPTGATLVASTAPEETGALGCWARSPVLSRLETRTAVVPA